MLGRLLADSGGADRIVTTILDWAGERRLPWALHTGPTLWREP
jgi:H+/gluconate symporter-like permease